MSCDGSKWECQYCTYLNWQIALKCTMCLSPKPLQMIEEGAPPLMSSLNSISAEESSFYEKSVSEDRNRILCQPTVPLPDFIGCPEDDSALIDKYEGTSNAPSIRDLSSLSPTHKSGLAQSYKSTSKNFESLEAAGARTLADLAINWRHNASWTCPNCSVLNWKTLSSCSKCNTKITNYSPTKVKLSHCQKDSGKEDAMKQISELVDYVNNKEVSNCKRNRSRTPSPIKTPPRLSSAPRVVQGAEKYISSPANSSPKNSSNSSNANQEKWTCIVCTFDNWPKSSKCVMCMCPRYFDQDATKNEIKQGNTHNFSQRSNLGVVDSVMVPSIANLSLNNRGSALECFGYGNMDIDDENSVNASYTEHNTSRGRRILRNNEIDRRWLDACCGAVDGNIQAIEVFLSSGGDPTRQLTEAEVSFLNRPSAFDIGLTLIHLALRFQQENVLATLLSQVDGQGPPVVKRVPSYAAPSVAIEIRRHVMSSIRQRKGSLRCHFSSEIATFTLPSEIEELPGETQETLFDEILDRDVQKELEAGQIINWSVDVNEQLNSRLYALWNRSAGDCLLDSVLQSTWGIFDRDNGFRRALSDSLQDCATQFYQRWKESELLHARLLNFSLNEAQCSADWANLLLLASQPGSSLEQLHIFALTHILRRPIIVYGVKYVKSFRGETLGYARFEGVYLPFLWEPSFCWRSPIALGYTRGHFSALVAMEPDCDPMARVDSASQLNSEDINGRSVYLPLTSVEGEPLPIQFLTPSEIGKEEFILSQWLDVSVTENGVMVARQRIQKRPLLVAQMVEEWLNHYRRLGQMSATPYMRQATATCYSSEGESDND